MRLGGELVRLARTAPGGVVERRPVAQGALSFGPFPGARWADEPAACVKVACDDLAAVVKDRDVSLLRNKHVLALEDELGLTADGGDTSAS